MHKTLIAALIFTIGCTETDTLSESATKVFLQSSRQNDTVQEMSLNLDPVEVVFDDVDAHAHLRMEDLNGREAPSLIAGGRVSFRPLEGLYPSIADVGDAWDVGIGSTAILDHEDDLEPGTAFVIDTFGGQDFLALVVDSTTGFGRCSEGAGLALDLQPIQGAW